MVSSKNFFCSKIKKDDLFKFQKIYPENDFFSPGKLTK